MAGSFDFEDIKRRMNAAVDDLKKDFGGLRTGRASASLLDPVMVTAYGNTVQLKSVANISVTDARMLSVQVWDRANVSAVEKAIRGAELGLNPVVDGQNLRIPLPDLTEERRRDLSKTAHKYTEQHRIAVRNVRRDGMDALKRQERDGDISQDIHRGRSDEVQKLTDAHIAKIDELLATKEKEIMQV